METVSALPSFEGDQAKTSDDQTANKSRNERPSSKPHNGLSLHALAQHRQPRWHSHLRRGTTIGGVPGTAAPIYLNFMDVVGSTTGALLSTGNLKDEINGVTVTCMDVAMPIVIARADAFGLSGYETVDELDANSAFYQPLEPIRRKAGY
nr:PrpF domain-containing protein [Rhizobium rhizophilum]